MEAEEPIGLSSIQCAKCGRPVIRTVVFQDGHIEAVGRPDLRMENGQELLRCPHCWTDNILVLATGRSGLPEHRVAGVRKTQAQSVMRQELSLGTHEYSLYVELSAPYGEWYAWALRDGTQLAGSEAFGSEQEAKESAHQWAYCDAGINDHFCKGKCAQWMLKG